MAAIDDALSAARGAHYGVIAGCAAALLFAATPDLTAPYRAAREDLRALSAIDWKRVSDSALHATQRTLNDSSKQVWRDFLISAGGGDTASFDTAFSPLGTDWRGKVLPLPDVSAAQSTISQLIVFGSGAVATIRRPHLLRDSALSRHAAPCYSQKGACTVGTTQISDTTYLVTIRGARRTKTGGSEYFVDSLRMNTWDVPMFRVSKVIEALYPATFVTTTDPAGKTVSAFVPRLAAIEPDIGKYTPVQAAGVLEEKIAGSERQLSGALGVPVRGNLITLAGPLLLILAIIYLVFQIDHLTDLAPGNEKAICDFAWPLTFRGYQGITTGIMTLLILPAMAVWLLRIRGGTATAFSLSNSYGVWTWTFLAFAVAAGLVAYRARNRLVRAMLA
jgi:hypothetical protein